MAMNPIKKICIAFCLYLITILYLVVTIISRTSSNILLMVDNDYINDNKDDNGGMDSRLLWPNDTSNCARFDVKFGKNLTFTYLASFPRSGNTWTRYLIEAATGIYTGSVFNSTLLHTMGFHGEFDWPESGRTIVIKSHGTQSLNYDQPYNPSEAPVVLLIRNVEKAIFSLWSFRAADNNPHLSNAPSNSYATTEFHYYVGLKILDWKKMNAQTLSSAKKLLVIFYENLVQDPLRELRRIVKFLGYEPGTERLACLNKHIMGPAKRKYTEIKNVFTKKEKKKMKLAMLTILTLLKNRKIEAPQEYLNYVENITQPIIR